MKSNLSYLTFLKIADQSKSPKSTFFLITMAVLIRKAMSVVHQVKIKNKTYWKEDQSNNLKWMSPYQVRHNLISPQQGELDLLLEAASWNSLLKLKKIFKKIPIQGKTHQLFVKITSIITNLLKTPKKVPILTTAWKKNKYFINKRSKISQKKSSNQTLSS